MKYILSLKHPIRDTEDVLEWQIKTKEVYFKVLMDLKQMFQDNLKSVDYTNGIICLSTPFKEDLVRFYLEDYDPQLIILPYEDYSWLTSA
jgi:hypothetical protein